MSRPFGASEPGSKKKRKKDKKEQRPPRRRIGNPASSLIGREPVRVDQSRAGCGRLEGSWEPQHPDELQKHPASRRTWSKPVSAFSNPQNTHTQCPFSETQPVQCHRALSHHGVKRQRNRTFSSLKANSPRCVCVRARPPRTPHVYVTSTQDGR